MSLIAASLSSDTRSRVFLLSNHMKRVIVLNLLADITAANIGRPCSCDHKSSIGSNLPRYTPAKIKSPIYAASSSVERRDQVLILSLCSSFHSCVTLSASLFVSLTTTSKISGVMNFRKASISFSTTASRKTPGGLQMMSCGPRRLDAGLSVVHGRPLFAINVVCQNRRCLN